MPDFEILDYADIDPAAKRNLLLGNGFSRSLHDGFKYGSLKEEAEAAGLIGDEVQNLFDRLGTVDFEKVLSRLFEAKLVNEAHGIPTEPLEQSYRATRDALVKVVQNTHPTRKVLDAERLVHYQQVLREFDRIFTTNYDLLLYWIAAQGDGLKGFRDFFWSRDNSFDPANARFEEGPTHLIYLHGALFLQRRTERVHKVKRAGSDLLTTLRKTLDSAAPVFVSEGDAAAKRRSIAQNDYLEWAYQQLLSLGEGITVFGHSLSEPDNHILEALCRGSAGTIAVSLYGDARWQQQEAANLYRRCIPYEKEKVLAFFDARTFPLLGRPAV